MKPLSFLLAAALLAIPSTAANANGCRVQKVVQEVAAVVAPVIPYAIIQAPLYQFSYTAPPAYTMPAPVYAPPQQQVYQPPQQPVQQQIQAEVGQDCCQALVAELAKLRAEIAALRGAPPIAGSPPVGAPYYDLKNRRWVNVPATGFPGGIEPLPPPPPDAVERPVPNEGVLKTRCAACHGPTNPKGEFALFLVDGKRVPLSIQQKARAKRMILADHMPPPLTAAEQAAGVQRPPLVPGEKETAMKEIDQP